MKSPNGNIVTTTARKMIVSAESRIESAISLGVFWRLAPSISSIMRSMNDSPGLAVTRTVISSESTLVPPVTAERSPPASRITGADSPVMADSSIVAAPSMISPSAAINSPTATTNTSPFRSDSASRQVNEPSGLRRLARVLVRLLRSVSAWALPRPSAMASAKFAKITVNHSQMEICTTNAHFRMPG